MFFLTSFTSTPNPTILIWIASGRHLEQTGMEQWLSWESSSRGVKNVRQLVPLTEPAGWPERVLQWFLLVVLIVVSLKSASQEWCQQPWLGGMRMKHRMKQGGGAPVLKSSCARMNKIIFISHKLQTEGPSVMATASLHHTASYRRGAQFWACFSGFEKIKQLLSFMMFHVSADLLLMLCISCVVLFDVSCFLYISACSGRREEPRLLTQRMRYMSSVPSH